MRVPPRTTTRRRGRLLVVLAALLALVATACGGDGETAAPDETDDESTATETETEDEGGEATEDETEVETVELRMATSGTTLLWIHMWIADEMGFFEAEGLEVEIIETPSGVTATQALLSGEVDVVNAPVGHVLDAVREHDRAVKAVAGLVSENANTMVMSTEWAEDKGVTEDSPIEERVEALRGARIGVVGPGSAVDDFARFVLETYGLDPDRDVELVGVGSSGAMAPAMSAGEVDAFVAGSPAAETSIVRGEAIKLISGPSGDVPAMAGQLFVAAVVSQQLIDERPEVVERIVRALYETQQFVVNSSDEVRDHLRESRFQDIEEEVWQMAWENTSPSYAADPVISEEAYAINFEVISLSRGREAGEPVDFERVVDNSFAEAVSGS